MRRISRRMIASVIYKRRLAKGLEEMESALLVALESSLIKEICINNYIVWLENGHVAIRQIPSLDKFQLRFKEFDEGVANEKVQNRQVRAHQDNP